MNCKEGDLAVTHSAPMDNGIIVEVIGASTINANRSRLWPLWVVKSLGSEFHITPTERSRTAAWPDSMLHPLRDNPGDDETLTWAPRKEPVAA